MKRSVGSTCRPSKETTPDAFYRISFLPLTHNLGGRGSSLLSGHGQTSLNPDKAAAHGRLIKPGKGF